MNIYNITDFFNPSPLAPPLSESVVGLFDFGSFGVAIRDYVVGGEYKDTILIVVE